MKLSGDKLTDFILESLRELAEIAQWTTDNDSLWNRADDVKKEIQELQRFRKPPSKAEGVVGR